jgi:hypothetical protein
MKTILIEGKRTPAFDNDLLLIIKTSGSEMTIDDNDDLIRIGVQNEKGEIYRIIDADDVLEFTRIIKLLQANRWPLENLAPASKKSFHVIVQPPEELQLKMLGINPDDPGSAV